MSKSVDTRVVQMQFDNRQFEKNINETIASLEKLDESLQLKDASKSFDKISQAAKEVNLSPIENAVDTVKVKFSALEVVAITALTNITNKAIYAGEKFVKSLSVDNVTAGWSKFEEVTTSTGTLINQGFDMSTVENQLNRLSFFADETSYSLTEMVSNMSKFTSKGTDIEKAAHAVEGIALWGALSGSNSAAVNRAMMQLSQVSRYVKYQDWQSIVTLSMDTIEFKNNAIEAAKAAGTLEETVDGIYKTKNGKKFNLNELFGEGLKTGWFTYDAFIDTVNKYSTAVDDLYDKLDEDKSINTATEAINKYGSELDAFGIKAFKAGQEARTWTDVINATKDAVSSQWQNIFKSIFGNYKEATKLFTGLANLFNKIFVPYGLADIFAGWKDLEGRETLLDGLAAGFYAIKDSINAVKNAFYEIFSSTDEDERLENKIDKLVKGTEKFREIMYKISAFVSGNAGNISNFFKGIFSIIKLITDGATKLIHTVLPVTKSISSFPQLILSILGVVGKVLIAFSEWIRESDVLSKLLAVISKIISFLGSVLLKIVSVMVAVGSVLKNAITNFMKLKPVQVMINAITTGFMLLGAAIYSAYNAIKNFLIVVTNPALAAESNSPIVKTISAIITFFKNLGTSVYNAVVNVKAFVASLSGLSIGERFKAIFNSIKEFKDNAINKIFGEPKESANGLLGTIDLLKKSLHDFFGEINIGTVMAIAFTASMIGVAGALANLLKSASALFGNASGLLGTIKKIVTKTYAKSVGVLNLAEAFTLIAGSLFLLSQADPTALRTAVIVMAKILGILTSMYVVVQLFSALLIKKKVFKNFEESIDGFAKTMIMLGASVLSIAAALLFLQHVEFSTKLIANLAIAVAAVGAIALIGTIVARFGKKGLSGISGIATILALALSLNKVVKAISNLSELDTEKVKETALAVAPILLAFGALAAGVGQIKIGSILALFILVKAFEKFIPELQQLGEAFSQLEASEFLNGLRKFLLIDKVLDAIAIVIMVFAIRGKQIGKATAGISLLLITMVGILGALMWLSKQKIIISQNIRQTFYVIGALVVAMEAMATFTQKNKMIKFAASLYLITGAIGLMVLLCNAIKHLELTTADFAPLYIFMGLLAVIEGLSALTGKAKILPLMVLMGSLLALMTMMVTIATIARAEGGTSSLIVATSVMAGLMVAYTVLIGVFGKFLQGTRKINWGQAAKTLSLIAILGAFTVALAVIGQVISHVVSLEKFNIANLIVTVGALALLIGEIRAFVIAFASIKTNNLKVFSAKMALMAVVMLSFGAVIAAIGYAISSMAKYEWKSIAAAAGSILATLAVISIIIALLGNIGPDKLLIGAGGLAAALLIFAGSLWLALKILNNSLDKYVETLTRIREVTSADPITVLVDQIINSANTLSSNKDVIVTSFETLGSYMVAGVVAGIEAHLVEVETAAGEIVSVTDATIRQKAGIESPSRLTKALGTFMGSGFAIGIANTSSMVIGAVLGVVGAGIDALTQATNGMSQVAEEGINEVKEELTIPEEEVPLADNMNAAMGEANVAFDEQATEMEERAYTWSERMRLYWSSVASYWGMQLSGTGDPLGYEKNKAEYEAAKQAHQEYKKGYNQQKTKENVQKVIKAAADAIGATELYDSFVDNGGVQGLYNKAKDTVETIKSEGITGVISNAFGTKLEDFWKEFVGEGFGDLGIGDDFQNQIDAMTSGFDDLSSSASKTKSTLESLKDTIKSQIDIFSKFEDQVEMIEEEVYDPETNTTSLVKREKTGAEMAEEMLANMESQIFGVTEWSNNMAKLAMMGMDEGLLQELGALGPKGASKVKAFVNMTSEQLQRANYLYATSVKLPDYAANEVASSYTYAGEMAIKGFSNALDQYAGIMNTYEIGEVAMEDISKAINETTVKIVAPQAKASGKDTGKEYVNGLSEGIDAEGPNSKVTSAAKRVAERVNKTVRTYLQINSPSRVAMKLGEFFTQGFAIGIGNKEEEAFDSASSMATAILNAVDSVTALMSTDSEFQPVLTPILDLSEIQNGAGELNTMFNNPQVAVASSAFNAKMEADRALIATQIENTRLLADAMQSNTDKVVDAIVNSNTPVNVNLTLQGDSAQLFKLVRQENAKFTKINGYNALAY